MEILTLLLDRIPELALSAISLFIVISKNEREKKEKKLERAMLLIKKKEELVLTLSAQKTRHLTK